MLIKHEFVLLITWIVTKIWNELVMNMVIVTILRFLGLKSHRLISDIFLTILSTIHRDVLGGTVSEYMGRAGESTPHLNNYTIASRVLRFE